MPVLFLDRDPALISIDRQRLADLGIPSEPGHECMPFHGVLGIMRSVLIVPEGWESMLPDELPVQEEWNVEEWELAQKDSSMERPEYPRPVPFEACTGIGAMFGLVVWTLIDAWKIVPVLHVLSQSSGWSGFADPALAEVLKYSGPWLLAGGIAGLLAGFVGRMLGTSGGRLLVACLVFFIYYVVPWVIMAAILSLARSRYR